MSAAKKKNKPDARRMKQGNLFSFFTKVSPKTKQSKPTNATPQVSSSKETSSAASIRVPSRSTPTSSTSNNRNWSKVKLNSRLAVFWPDDKKYYPAVVKKESSDRTRFLLEYEDGDVEWVNLKTEKFRFIDDDDYEEGEEEEVDMGEEAQAEKASKQQAKKRRRIQEEDSDEEFEFEMDAAEEDADELMDCDEEVDDQWLVSDEDESGPTIRKKGSNKNKSSKKPKITEHKISSSSPQASMTTVSPKSSSTPKSSTPEPTSLANFSAFSASQTPRSHQVTPPAPARPADSDAVVDDPDNWNGEKAIPYVRDAVNPVGAHLHNHLEFLRNPKDANGRSRGDPGYNPRTLKVDMNELKRHYNPPNNKSKALSPGVQQCKSANRFTAFFLPTFLT